MLNIKLNIKNLLKITKSQLFTGLALSASLLSYAGLEACEECKATAVATPVARWESPSLRRRREAAAAEAAAGTLTVDTTNPHNPPAQAAVVPAHSLENFPWSTPASAEFAIISIDTIGINTLAGTPTGRAVALSDCSPLEPTPVRSGTISRRSSLKSHDTDASICTSNARKRVSFAAAPEIREFDPQSLTYREELNIALARQAENAASEERIAAARRIHDARDIADLGRNVRLAYTPKSARFATEYSKYLRAKSFYTTTQATRAYLIVMAPRSQEV